MKYEKIFLILSIISALVIIATTINNYHTMDEVFFVKSWEVMNDEGGLSILSLKKTQEDFDNPFDEKTYADLKWENYHPPLWRMLGYFYTAVFGTSTGVVRSMGLIFYAISIFLVYKITTLFTDKKSIHYLTISFLLISPYLMVNSMTAHIDTQLLAIPLLLFTYYFIKKGDASTKHMLVLSSIYAFAWFAKELLPVFMSMAVFAYYLIRKQWKKAFLNTAFITVIGTAFFLVVWYVLAFVFHIPFEGWFMETIWEKVFHGEFQKSSTSFFIYLFIVVTRTIWKALFYNPAFLILIALGFYSQWKQKRSRWDLLYVFIAVQFFFFVFYFYENLYYLFTALVASTIVVAKLLYDKKAAITKNNIISFLALLIYYILLKNPGIKLQNYWVQTHQSGIKVISPDIYILVGYLFLYFLPIIILLLARIKISQKSFIAYLLILFFASSLAFNAYQVQDYSTAVLWNNYGEEGFAETLDYLKEHQIPNTSIVTRKDFEYYLYKDFEENNILYIYNKYLRFNEVHSQKTAEKIDYSQVSFITTDMYTKDFNLPEGFSKVFEYSYFAIYKNDNMN